MHARPAALSNRVRKTEMRREVSRIGRRQHTCVAAPVTSTSVSSDRTYQVHQAGNTETRRGSATYSHFRPYVRSCSIQFERRIHALVGAFIGTLELLGGAIDGEFSMEIMDYDALLPPSSHTHTHRSGQVMLRPLSELDYT